jgi:hypothetical protein
VPTVQTIFVREPETAIRRDDMGSPERSGVRYSAREDESIVEAGEPVPAI